MEVRVKYLLNGQYQAGKFFVKMVGIENITVIR